MYADKAETDRDDFIMHECDVCRRTSEFFDNQLGRLREIGIASSVAIIGIAFQFRPEIGILLLPINTIFTLLDRRTQRYLKAVSTYASKLEENYRFAGSGLTHSIRGAIGGAESSIYRYFVYLINAGFLATGTAFLWSSLARYYPDSIAAIFSPKDTAFSPAVGVCFVLSLIIASGGMLLIAMSSAARK